MNIRNYDGMRFGRHVVIKRDHKDKNGKWWFLCKCDCGKEFYLGGSHVLENVGCGCGTGKQNITHGKSKTRLFKVWTSLKTRCNNPNSPSYKNYGGRGITICDEWKSDFMNFWEWSYANGYDDKAGFMECTLDRIDCDGNYEPSNCRWVDLTTQNNNKRCNHRLTLNGVTHTMGEWAKIRGMTVFALSRRIRSGWSVEDALMRPIDEERASHRKKVKL